MSVPPSTETRLPLIQLGRSLVRRDHVGARSDLTGRELDVLRSASLGHGNNETAAAAIAVRAGILRR